MEIVALIEHDRGEVADVSFQALAFAQSLGATGVHAVVVGPLSAELTVALGANGATSICHIDGDLTADYDPEVWGEALAAATAQVGPQAVVGLATDRSGEVLAHAAAIADAPLAANVTAVSTGSDEWAITRIRWGGALIEQASLKAPVRYLTAAVHVFVPQVGGGTATVNAVTPNVNAVTPNWSATAGRTQIVDRITLASGITLTTAAVVVSGGRGVGSPEGFAKLDELAGLISGAVGCSRVVTNAGWRPHSDQVGQTGKRIAPELYIACGISGATQHWVGMMASKKVLAINTDRDANMVNKADYAVIGDLHEILPAISAEIRRRKS